MASNAELFGDDDSSSSSEVESTAMVVEDGPSASSPQEETVPAAADPTVRQNPVEDAAALVVQPPPSSKENEDDDTLQEEKTTTTTTTGPTTTSTTTTTSPPPPPPSEDPTPNTTSTPKVPDNKDDENHDDDDSDDGSDAEFDDAGAVVGLQASSKPKTKVPVAEKNDDTLHKKSKAKTDRRILVVPKYDDNNKSLSPQLEMTKLPNLVGIQTQPFEEDTYDALQEEDDFGPAAYNLMRWRYNNNNTNNTSTTESNTRLVKWDDGSLTLHVGTECFPVDVHQSVDGVTGFAGLNGYLYLSQQASYKQVAATTTTDEENNHHSNDDDPPPMVTPAGTVLECVGPIHSRWAVRPSSLQSDAHQSLTVKIRQKTLKQARIAEFVTQEDPEKLKRDRLRLQNDLDRAMMGRKQQQQGGGAFGGAPASRRPRMSRGYLEADEDEDGGQYDTTNLRDMKRRTMMGEKDDDDGLEDYDGVPRGEDDDDDEQVFRRVRPRGSQKPTKSKKDESEDEDIFLGDDDDDDDDDEGFVAKAKRKTQTGKKRSHQAVLDDDDEDDESD